MIIKNWSEIQERYEAIKDHKPRASKKLNELGDILASAYAIDPNEASAMWQYIIDLNINDDITFSKFYIAQVFNKLSDRMEPDEATEFLGMNPERVRLMIMHGYDGGTLWTCLDTLIQGYIVLGDADGAMSCVEYFYEKFGGINSGLNEIVKVAGSVARICCGNISAGKGVEPSEVLLSKIEKTSNEQVNGYVEIIKAIHNVGGPHDYLKMLDRSITDGFSTEFFQLLWAARETLDKEELRDKWLDYIRYNDTDSAKPWDYLGEDGDDYDNSKLKHYVDLEKDSDELLDYYFNQGNLYDIEKGVIWSWIEERNWERFTKYLSQAVMCIQEFEWSDVKSELNDYMEAISDGGPNTWDKYNRNFGELMKPRKEEFIAALAKISAITVGCNAHESFHEFIKHFIQKTNGNLDALNSVGFEDEIETRTAEQQLKEYVHEFFMSGEQIHTERNTKYSLIEDALHDELYDSDDSSDHTVTIDITGMVAKALGIDFGTEGDDKDEEEETDQEAERDYRLAQDDEIAEFYFQHFPQAYTKRKELISACVWKRDFSRAIELIDIMAETKGNEGYDELNGWGRQNMLTMMYLIDEYAYGKEERWDTKKGITDEMREVVKQLVHRMMPYLSQSAAAELKEKSLYKIDPESEDTDEYITQLMEDADVYTSFPKPRGKGGAPNINRMSQEFINCFERLSKMGRLDVVAEIMGKFAAVRNVLKPITFDRWMGFMASGLRSGDMIKIFRQNKGIFEEWLEMDQLEDLDILSIARGIADGSTRADFMEFRNLVISRRGKVEGLDICYQATAENTENQEVFNGETVNFELERVSDEELLANKNLNQNCPEEIRKVLPRELERDVKPISKDDDDLSEVDALFREQLYEVLNTLTDREQRVLCLRFGIDDGITHTLSEIGIFYGQTEERIRQIEDRALRKLRHPSRARKLKAYVVDYNMDVSDILEQFSNQSLLLKREIVSVSDDMEEANDITDENCKEITLESSIEDLQLSVRSYYCLRRAGISTVGDLYDFTVRDLLCVRNFSLKCIDELFSKLPKLELNELK